MRVNVKAKPGAREEKVDPSTLELWQAKKNCDPLGINWITVSVKEPPIQGKANIAIIKALAKFFGVSSFQIRLVSGFSSKQKVFEIS